MALRYDQREFLRGIRMIWALAIVTVLALAVAFTTHSPALLAFGLFLGIAGLLTFAVILIDRHMRASSRPEHMTPGELDALKATLRKGPPPPPQLPPSQDH